MRGAGTDLTCIREMAVSRAERQAAGDGREWKLQERKGRWGKSKSMLPGSIKKLRLLP